MRVANPYANLHALLDTTRQLDPEEMAELQLEQGFVERALAIYEELTAKEPDNAGYQRRRAWLERLVLASKEEAPPAKSAEPDVVRSLRIVRVR